MERRAGRRSSSLANLRMKPRERPPRSPTRAPWPDRLTAPAPEAATAGDLPEPGPLNGEGSLRQRMDAEWGQGPGAEDPQEDTPRAEIQDKGPVAGQGRGDQGFEGDVKRRGRLSPRAAGVAAGFYTGRRALTADLSTSKAPGRRATPSRDEVAPELGGKSELQEASRGAHASTHLTRKELQHSSPTSNRAGAGRGRGSSGCACPTAESLGRTLGSGGAGETLVGGGGAWIRDARLLHSVPRTAAVWGPGPMPHPDIHIHPSPDPSPHPGCFQAFSTRPSGDPGTSLIINNVLFQGESPGLGCNTTHILKAKTQLRGWSGAKERAVFC